MNVMLRTLTAVGVRVGGRPILGIPGEGGCVNPVLCIARYLGGGVLGVLSGSAVYIYSLVAAHNLIAAIAFRVVIASGNNF